MFVTQQILKRPNNLLQFHIAARAVGSSRLAMTNQFVLPAAQNRWFATDRTGGADEGSHDDFQPKSKASSSEEVTEHITNWINENDVCLFMKGTRKMPQCGFSRYVVVLFNAYGVKQFKDVNVLADDNLRNTIKEYSNWPTIPQVYIKGEFVGGCDIMKEMHEDGSLRELLIRENIIAE